VQDFNLAVQEAVHRVQTIEETQAVMGWSRKYGFQSRSVDLIYGLPKQTPETFKETVAIVLAMRPDRLAVYNYAHLPNIFKPQRRISEADLPLVADKLNILSNTIEHLTDMGYVFIGMDHFARPDDELAIAQKESKLHRNFQGYSTQADCDLLAFGISSIGKVDDCYSQNVRTLDEYYESLDQDHLPALRGMQLDKDDLLRRELIGELLCQFTLNTKVFADAHDIDFLNYFKIEMKELKSLEEAGLVEWQGANITVPIKGRLLARRVAMTFDRHLRESQAIGTYSKVL
jgi:oxygen-independent coproporphyrinogen-3 oxidase